MNYHYMYTSDAIFETKEAEGEKLKAKNKSKELNLMNLAINMADEEIINEITKVFLELSPKDMKDLKLYLNERKYMKKSINPTKEQKIINKIALIAVNSRAKNETLKNIQDSFKNNLEEIDILKSESTKTRNLKEVEKIIKKIEFLNNQNANHIINLENYKLEQKDK